MIRRLRTIKAVIQKRYPESRLEPLTAREMARLKRRFPDLPAHLVNFFQVIGCGSIGNSRYKIYDLHSPEDIFDKRTAADLEGVVLVGDNFGGTHEAYDTRAKWRFGWVATWGTFYPHTDYATIIDLIESWYVNVGVSTKSRTKHKGKYIITVSFPIAIVTRTGDRPVPGFKSWPPARRFPGLSLLPAARSAPAPVKKSGYATAPARTPRPRPGPPNRQSKPVSVPPFEISWATPPDR